MNRAAARWVAHFIQEAVDTRGSCVFMPSAGRTPMGLYEILRAEYLDAVDWASVTLVQMDEYVGLGANDPYSLASCIETHLARPLGIEEFVTFNDDRGRLRQNLTEYEAQISALGGLDVTLFGIGENGHLGFNEPGSGLLSPTRVLPLDDRTIHSNFSESPEEGFSVPENGITVGLPVLLSSRRSLLIASGARKEEAVLNLLGGPVSPEWPATFLRGQLGAYVMITDDCVPAGAERETGARGRT
nr:6-phosphogluconolactonase [Microbacterium sp. No. 7]